MSATALNLRSPNFKSVKVTAPSAGYTAGQMLKKSQLVGVIVDTVDLDEETALIYAAEKIVVPKDTGITFAIGDKVYFRSATSKVTSTASGNTLCGRALEAAGTNATEVEIELMGNVAA